MSQKLIKPLSSVKNILRENLPAEEITTSKLTVLNKNDLTIDIDVL